VGLREGLQGLCRRSRDQPSDDLKDRTDTEQKVYDEMERAHGGMSDEERRYYEFYKLQVLMNNGFELGDYNYTEIQKNIKELISYEEAGQQAYGRAESHWRTFWVNTGIASSLTAGAIALLWVPGGWAASIALGIQAGIHTALAAVALDKANSWDTTKDEARGQAKRINAMRHDARSASVTNLSDLETMRTKYEDNKAELDLMSGAADDTPNTLDDLTDAILKAYEVSDKDLSIIGDIADFDANRESLRTFLSGYYDEDSYSSDDLADNSRLLKAVRRTADQAVQDAYEEREAHLWDNSPDQKGIGVRYQEASAELEALEEEFQSRGVLDALPDAGQVKQDLDAWQQALSDGTDASALRTALVNHTEALLLSYDAPNMADLGFAGDEEGPAVSAFRYEVSGGSGSAVEYYAPNQALWTIKQAYEDYLDWPTDAGADYLGSLLLDYQERYQLYVDYQLKLDEVHGLGPDF
jgi:hypothetical protein